MSSGAKTSDYGRGAALLTAGIGITGLVTFAFFSISSHALSQEQYGQIALLWSVVFMVTPVFYRPIEQLLARTIAERRARDQAIGEPLRMAGLIQLGLAALFAALALIFREPLQDDLFDGNETLYWVMFASVIAYAVSYFGRGLLAGHQRFGLYGLLVFIEATTRIMFPIAVLVGIASGQSVVALGILAGPVISLFVVPLALLGRRRADHDLAVDPRSPAEQAAAAAEGEARFDAASGSTAQEEAQFTLSEGGGFALAALVIMACEQTILNAAPLIAKGTAGGAAAAAAVINILVIARAPMQLFQSVSTSLLPHLSKLRATGDFATYRRSVRLTLLAIAAAAGFGVIVMLACGPWLMKLVFGEEYAYERAGLAAITLGMGVYLCAATLNQAALAARRTAQATVCWLIAAVGFVVWMLLPVVEDPLRRVEIGYPASAILLFVSLFGLYLVSTPRGASCDS
ncbi:MAG: oligosaccharide flippase family protein [Actinobacteria bacterium]|nr:oligosaccharide flippase family protein [Actinomycetota bacterium]